MLKKILWAVLLVAVVAWGLNSRHQNQIKKEQRIVEENQRKNRVIAKISKLKEETESTFNWLGVLKGDEEFRLNRVLTIELEKAWIENGPILFHGVLEDIATISDGQYIVKLEEGLWNDHGILFTELRLNLNASVEVVDELIQQHPELLDEYSIANGITVSASISSVKTSTETNEDGESEEIKTGIGELRGVVFTGDVGI